MKKRIIFVIAFLLMLTSCQPISRTEPNVNDTVQLPRNQTLEVQGTWALTEIEELGENLTTLSQFEVGDELYITRNLVAINAYFSNSPTFSSKYVSLQSYLDYRYTTPPSLNGFDEEYIEIMMVRDRDALSLDLLSLEEDVLCFTFESRAFYFERVDEQVSSEVIEEYQQLAQNNRINPAVIIDDLNMSVLIGIRTRRLDENGFPYYKYTSYLISDIWSNSRPLTYSTQEIISGDEEGTLTRIDYNIIERDPEIGVTSGEFVVSTVSGNQAGSQVILQDFYHRMINYVYNNVISFTKTSLPQVALNGNSRANPRVNEFEIYTYDRLQQEQPLTVEQIGGPEEAISFREQVLNQLNIVDPEGTINASDVQIDYTNIGIRRNNSGWGFVSSKDWVVGDNVYPTVFGIDLVPLLPMVQINTLQIPWSRVMNKTFNAESAFTTEGQERIIIKTDDEIQYYQLIRDQISASPELSIQIPSDSEIIMVNEFYDATADLVTREFMKLPLLQPQVIYPNK